MGRKTLPTNEMADQSDKFAVMYEANAPLIYRFMFWRTKDKMLAEDLTSSVFEKAWLARSSYTGGSIKAWLYRIARNTLIDHWRKRHDVLVEDPEAIDVASEEAGLDVVLDQDALLATLQNAVSKLPKEMRQVVTLRFIEGLSARQTGQRLGVSEANVRVIQYRALRKLRGYLK